MKHCQRCNLDLPDAYKFCKSCGGNLTDVSQRCPNCSVVVQPEWSYCNKCRMRITPIPPAPSPRSVEISSGPGYARPANSTQRSVPDPPQSLATVVENSALVPCLACNQLIEDNARFCEHCGATQDDVQNTTVSPITTPQLQATRADINQQIAPTQNSVESVDEGVEAQLDEAMVEETARPTDSYSEETSTGILFSYAQPTGSAWPKWGIIAGISAVFLVIAAGAIGGYWMANRKASVKRTTQPTTAQQTSSTPVRRSPPTGMVHVPGGRFLMGRDEGDEYERPSHEVNVIEFYIDKYEVTNEEYEKFVQATGTPAPIGWKDGMPPANSGRLPVTGVSWVEAIAYAQWAGKRLPTEEEWEYAARGTDRRLYPWGNDWRPDAVNSGSAQKKLDEVGSRPENLSPFGAYDMVGNAWEWTASNMTAYPGGAIPPPPAGTKVIRGGSWQSNQQQATTTYRYGWPAQGGKDYGNTGFRCVMNVVQQ